MNRFHIIGEWLYEWQTLVGAAIALAAAWRTIVVMQNQMRGDAERHQDALRRKQLAARAKMPDALSEMSGYVRGCADRLTGLAKELPADPTSAVAALKEVIEFIDDGAATRTFELVSWYQVVRARLTRSVPKPNRVEFGESMYDLTLLQGYANSLFEYARNEEQAVKGGALSPADMDNALRNAFDLEHMIRHEHLYTGVREIIARRHGGGKAKGDRAS